MQSLPDLCTFDHMPTSTITPADISCWPDTPPAAPPSSWKLYVFPMRDRPGLWTVTARHGAAALRIEGLTAQDVRTFDATSRWHRQ